MKKHFSVLFVLVLIHWTGGLTIASDPPVVRIMKGKVADSSGKPIEGALVEWGHFHAAPSARESVKTDARGIYKLKSTKIGSDYRLGIFKDGFSPVWVDGLIPGRTDNPDRRTVQLVKCGELRGVVVDRKGKPMEGITVLAKSASTGFHSSFSMPTPSFPFPGPDKEGVTNAKGEFVIRNLPTNDSTQPQTVNPPRETRTLTLPARVAPYEFSLSIRVPRALYPRGTFSAEKPIRLSLDRTDDPNMSAEERKGVLSAMVVDEVTGKPITQFQYAVRHRPKLNRIDDQAGHFQVTNVVHGRRYQLLVYANGYAPEKKWPLVATKPDKPELITFKLKPSKGVRGVVVDSYGQPIVGAKIVFGIDKQRGTGPFLDDFAWDSFDKYIDGYMGYEFVQRMTTTNDGRFEFSEADSKGNIAILADGFDRRLVRGTDRPAADSDGLIRLTLQSKSRFQNTIKGIVKLNNQPEPNAQLHLASRNRRGSFLRADKSGAFTFRNLATGTYTLSVYQYSGGMGTARLTCRFEIKPNQTSTTLLLNGPQGKLKLRGKATPFSLISVSSKTGESIDGHDDPMYTHVGTITNADGEYQIEGLQPGLYSISAKPASRRSGYISNGHSKDVAMVTDTELDLTSPLSTLMIP